MLGKRIDFFNKRIDFIRKRIEIPMKRIEIFRKRIGFFEKRIEIITVLSLNTIVTAHRLTLLYLPPNESCF
jgi:hypothetical protein